MQFIQPTDKNALGKLQEMAKEMPLEEMIRFCEGLMNALIVVQDQFNKRFPAEFEAWNKSIDEGK